MNANEQTDQVIEQIMAKVRADDSFKQRLLADATATLKAEGVDIPNGVKVNVMENTRAQWNFVLPSAANEELSDADLEAVAGGAQIQINPKDHSNRPTPITISDVRLKTDIRLLERLTDGPAAGLGLYRYRYLWSDTVFVGVMAQEVVEVDPEAVTLAANGFLAVDYARLGLRLMTLAQWTAQAASRSPATT